MVLFSKKISTFEDFIKIKQKVKLEIHHIELVGLPLTELMMIQKISLNKGGILIKKSKE